MDNAIVKKTLNEYNEKYKLLNPALSSPMLSSPMALSSSMPSNINGANGASNSANSASGTSNNANSNSNNSNEDVSKGQSTANHPFSEADLEGMPLLERADSSMMASMMLHDPVSLENSICDMENCLEDCFKLVEVGDSYLGRFRAASKQRETVLTLIKNRMTETQQQIDKINSLSKQLEEFNKMNKNENNVQSSSTNGNLTHANGDLVHANGNLAQQGEMAQSSSTTTANIASIQKMLMHQLTTAIQAQQQIIKLERSLLDAQSLIGIQESQLKACDQVIEATHGILAGMQAHQSKLEVDIAKLNRTQMLPMFNALKGVSPQSDLSSLAGGKRKTPEPDTNNNSGTSAGNKENGNGTGNPTVQVAEAMHESQASKSQASNNNERPEKRQRTV